MADTIRAEFQGVMCDDCKMHNVKFKHWGPLVPEGITGYFCGPCFVKRGQYYDKNGKPKPMQKKE